LRAMIATTRVWEHKAAELLDALESLCVYSPVILQPEALGILSWEVIHSSCLALDAFHLTGSLLGGLGWNATSHSVRLGGASIFSLEILAGGAFLLTSSEDGVILWSLPSITRVKVLRPSSIHDNVQWHFLSRYDQETKVLLVAVISCRLPYVSSLFSRNWPHFAKFILCVGLRNLSF
jgi:hypothetical protein